MDVPISNEKSLKKTYKTYQKQTNIVLSSNNQFRKVSNFTRKVLLCLIPEDPLDHSNNLQV